MKSSMKTPYATTSSQKSLQILDGITLGLVVTGFVLLLTLTKKFDLQVLLIAFAGVMLGVTTVASMRRRNAGLVPAPVRLKSLAFALQIMPSLLVLAATCVSLFKGS